MRVHVHISAENIPSDTPDKLACSDTDLEKDPQSHYRSFSCTLPMNFELDPRVLCRLRPPNLVFLRMASSIRDSDPRANHPTRRPQVPANHAQREQCAKDRYIGNNRTQISPSLVWYLALETCYSSNAHAMLQNDDFSFRTYRCSDAT